MRLSSDSTNEEQCTNGNNLLHTCTDLAEAKRLVSRGVNINQRNFLGQVPIHSLMRLGNPETAPIIMFLLEFKHTHVNAAEPDGTTIAHLCEWGPIITDLGINENFNPNKVRDSDGNTPLMFCIMYPKHPDIAKRLLEDPRIDLEVRNTINGKTALQMAEESTTEYGKQILVLIRDKIADSKHMPLMIAPAFAMAITVAPPLIEQAESANITMTKPHI